MDSSKRKVLGVEVEISQSNSVSETGLQSLKFLEGEKKQEELGYQKGSQGSSSLFGLGSDLRKGVVIRLKVPETPT